ncbi:MAG: hypothetical protein Fur0037_28510 [Planctomycetota bacterium]
MSAPAVSVVVAVSDRDAHPRKLADETAAALRAAGYSCEFVFVLDGPLAPLEREIESIECGFPVRIVRLQGGGLGESIALSAGVARAAGRYILNVPPYLQVVPEDLVKVLAALDAGADCVATWRSPRVDPWLNQLQSRLFNRVMRFMMGIPFHDLNSGTRGFRRQVLEEVSVYGELYRFLPVLARRQGFKVVEVKVRHREEKGRTGFYGLGVYLRRLLDILAITFLTRFTQRPLRFFGYLGFASIVAGLAMTAAPLYQKLVNMESLTDRPLFVIGSILVAFGVQLIGFGLVGEIIIFTQSPNLRDYKVEEIVEHESEPAAPAGARALAEGPWASANGPTRDQALPVLVRELLPGEDSRWDAFVSRHSQGTFFHLSGWSRVVAETFRHESHALVAERGRRWVGILPLFFVKSPFLGRNLISVPYAVYGGALADDDEAFSALVSAAESLGRQRGAGYVELRHLEQRPGNRQQSSLYVTFRRDLPGDPAEVMPSIPKKARAEVRKARKALAAKDGAEAPGYGLSLVEGCDIDLFFDLFAENKGRLGSPTLPKKWFRALQEEFGRAVALHRAVAPDGTTLAAVMSFCFKDTVYAYYSGSRSGVNRTGVNDFIYCAIMEWAVRQGFGRFDFGRSRSGSGPANFKKNMGFSEEPLHYEYLMLRPGAKMPDFHPSNPRLDLPRRIWSNIPMFLANPIGGRLSRYLP